MPKRTHHLTHSPQQITTHTNSISSTCHAILFDNYGEQGAKIYVNDTSHAHSGTEYIYLPPGQYISLGNDSDYLVKDVFDVVFTGSGSIGMNVVKQFVERIEY